MKILVAEDDGVARRLLEDALATLGHEVVLARDGAEAWSAFRRDRYGIVLSDWLMPELDGLELVRRIRGIQSGRYTYVIMVTALGERSEWLEAMRAGADDFLTKPVDSELLAVRLRVAERIVTLQEEVSQLSGLLSVCSYCRRIREGEERWTPIEVYVARRTEASFTHGYCPDCYEKHVVPELERARRELGKRDGG